MPLLDHFHPPTVARSRWPSFHGVWAGVLVQHLNEVLPDRFTAEMEVHLGTEIQADVAEWEAIRGENPNGTSNGVGVATYSPPVVTAVLEAVFPDDVEVRIIDRREGYDIVAVIELVSPSNKDRPESRRAFSAKCGAHLTRGVGLLVVDIVTARRIDLFAELLQWLNQPQAAALPAGIWLHAAAYRPIRREGNDHIDLWLHPLAVGMPLPTLPLPLRGAGCLALDLEASYAEARTRSRL